MKCYRIWFSDGTAILQDAVDEEAATKLGKVYLDKAQPLGDSFAGMTFDDIVVVDRVECLDGA